MRIHKPMTAVDNPMHSKTLPAVNPLDSAATRSDMAFDTAWMSLDRLPGYMWSAIRNMGESVFSPLTRTRLGDIQVIASLAGRDPHAQQDINRIADRLRRTAGQVKAIEYSSGWIKRLLGAAYEAQAIQVREGEYAYLLVKDCQGSYIYRWPAVDTLVDDEPGR